MEKLDLTTVDWQQVLQSLGVPAQWIENPRRQGPCPIEAAGKTRFRLSNKTGRGEWICNTCGSGDGVRLVALLKQCSDADAIRYLKAEKAPTLSRKVIALREQQKVKTAKDALKQKVRLQKLWDDCSPVREGDPVALYLARRVPGLKLEWLSNSIRFCESLFHADEGDLDANKKPKISYRPAMVAKVTQANGWPVTLHRTYLAEDGFKASVTPDQVKKQMAGVAPLSGEAIHLNVSKGGSDILCITEGIETGYAVVAAYENSHDVWAALNAGNLPKIQVPKTYSRVIIFADKDPMNPKNGWRPGEHYAELLAKRLRTEGLEVVIRVPDREGTDFADLWLDVYERRRLQLVA